jgi:hypothetical protein
MPCPVPACSHRLDQWRRIPPQIHVSEVKSAGSGVGKSEAEEFRDESRQSRGYSFGGLLLGTALVPAGDLRFSARRMARPLDEPRAQLRPLAGGNHVQTTITALLLETLAKASGELSAPGELALVPVNC